MHPPIQRPSNNKLWESKSENEIIISSYVINFVLTSLGLRSYIFNESKSGPPMESVGGLLGPSPNINFMSSSGACHLTNLQKV